MKDEAKQRNSADGLVGKFFLSFNHRVDNRVLEWQGVVSCRLEGGFYLVQLFDWLVGEPSAQHVVHLSGMTTWEFFGDDATWRSEGNRHSRATREAIG